MGKYSSDSDSSIDRRRTRRRRSDSSSPDDSRRRRRSTSRSRHKSSRHGKSRRSRSRSRERRRDRRRSRSRDRGRRGKRSRSPEAKKEKEPKKSFGDDLVREKLWKAIHDAEDVKPDAEALRLIEEDSFVQRNFSSSKNQPVDEPDVVEVNKQKVALVDVIEPDNIFHPSFFVDVKTRLDRWTKKLFQIRQKALEGMPFSVK